MNPAALLKLVREVGPAKFSESRTRPGGVDPFSKMPFLPGIEESFRDPYTAQLKGLLEEEAMTRLEAKGPEAPRGRLFDPDIMDPRNRESMPAPTDSGEGPIANMQSVPHGTYTWDEWQATKGQPGEAPNTHGFDVYEFGEGDALTIPGLRYREPRPERVGEPDPLVSRMEDTETAMREYESRIAGATRFEDIAEEGDSAINRLMGHSWGERTGRGIPAKFNQDSARLDFAEMGEGDKRGIIQKADWEASRSADVPSEQGEFATKASKHLRDSGKPVVAGLRFDKFGTTSRAGRVMGERSNTPYEGLLEAIAAGGVRGSFSENVPPNLRVGELFPLRIHPRSAVDVRVKGVHAYDPNGPLAERLRLLEMMGRGAQDQGEFGKPGTVIEWEAMESIPLKQGQQVEVGSVVPVERKNGKTVQMEVVHIKEGPSPKMLVRPVLPEENDARATLRFAAADEAGKNSKAELSNVMNLHNLLGPEWQKFFDSRRLVREGGKAMLKPASSLTPETPSAPFDMRRAQTFTLRSKRTPDDNFHYYSGARAVPMDREGRKWVVVNTHVKRRPVDAGTQGLDLVEIDDRGMATVTKYGADAKPLRGEDGNPLRFEIPIVQLFNSRQLDDMIIPNLPKWRRKVRPRNPNRPLPEQPASITESGRAKELEMRLARAATRQELGTPLPRKTASAANISQVEDGVNRKGAQEFARIEPDQTRSAATERVASMMVRELQEMKQSKNLPTDDLESQLQGRLENDPQASAYGEARTVLKGADVPLVRDEFLDSMIGKLQTGERLTPRELDIAQVLVSPRIFDAYTQKGAPEYIKDNPGSSRPNMMPGSKNNARDITEGRTRVVNYKGPLGKDADGNPTVVKAPKDYGKKVQEGSPIKPSSTYRGKETKQGLLKTEAPAKNSGLRMVEKFTTEDIKRHADTVFIVNRDVNASNAINIKSLDANTDVSKLLRGGEAVISKGVVDSLTPEQKATLRRLFPSNKKLPAALEMARRGGEKPKKVEGEKPRTDGKYPTNGQPILPEDEVRTRGIAKREGIADDIYSKRKAKWDAGSEDRDSIAKVVRAALQRGEKLTKSTKKGVPAERTELDIVNGVLAVLRKNK